MTAVLAVIARAAARLALTLAALAVAVWAGTSPLDAWEMARLVLALAVAGAASAGVAALEPRPRHPRERENS